MIESRPIFEGQEIVRLFQQLGLTHVIWVPDSTTGTWEAALREQDSIQLLRVCREGEAWPLAAGLLLGGRHPVVIMQSTGLFESGDALRNVLYDLQIPVFAIIGARNWLTEGTSDSARRFIQPVLEAWGIHYAVIGARDEQYKLEEQYQANRQTGRARWVLLAEGKG